MVHNLNRAETMPNIYADDVFGDLEPIPQFYGCFGVVATVAFFRGANVLVSKFNKPQGLTVEFWRFKNLYISWIHAIVTGLWSLLRYVQCCQMLNFFTSHEQMNLRDMSHDDDDGHMNRTVRTIVFNSQ